GGVVDQHVEPAQRRDRVLHVGAHRVALGEVDAGDMDLVAVARDLGLGLLERRDVAGADRDVAPGFRDAERNRLANAAAAAADDGLLAREVDFHDAISPDPICSAQFADGSVSVSTPARRNTPMAQGPSRWESS